MVCVSALCLGPGLRVAVIKRVMFIFSQDVLPYFQDTPALFGSQQAITHGAIELAHHYARFNGVIVVFHLKCPLQIHVFGYSWNMRSQIGQFKWKTGIAHHCPHLNGVSTPLRMCQFPSGGSLLFFDLQHVHNLPHVHGELAIRRRSMLCACSVFFKCLSLSRNRITIPIRIPHNRNMFRLQCGFHHPKINWCACHVQYRCVIYDQDRRCCVGLQLARKLSAEGHELYWAVVREQFLFQCFCRVEYMPLYDVLCVGGSWQLGAACVLLSH